tara:strand:- start:44805 stop:47579 length:2775 start_codon:yes stop_codon:yes gene_type:complete
MNGSRAKIRINNKLGVGITPSHALDIVRGPEIEDFLDPVRVDAFRNGPGHILVWNEDNNIIYRTKNYISGQGGPNLPHLVLEQKSPTLQLLSGSIQFVPASATTESNSGLYNGFHTEVKSDPLDISSFVITGSSNAKFYLSGSGKIGIGTTDPQEALDLRADTFQLQRQAERKGIKLNAEGNIETFDNTEGSAATGSEIIINYSRGVTITAESLEAIVGVPFSSNAVAEASFSADFHPDEQTDILKKAEAAGFLNPPQTGDTLGAIRWVAASGSNDGYANRIAGEAANITALVSDIDETGVKGDLSFRVAGKSGAPAQKLLLDAGGLHEVTGSLLLTADVHVGSGVYHRGDPDTRLGFSNDNVYLAAGGEFVAQAVPSQFTIGDGGNIDLQVKAVGDQYNLFSDGGNAKVGIGTSTPSEKLTVVGNISSSGNIYTDTNIIATGSIEALGNVTAVSFIGNATGLTGTPNITVGNISATSITTLNLTSSFITSSTIQTSGSNVFGDDLSDTHTFIGHVTASGNISAIGDISASGNGIFANVKIPHNGEVGYDSNNHLSFGSTSVGVDATVFNVNASNRINFHDANVGIRPPGTSTVAPEALTVEGNISASGNIISEGNVTADYYNSTTSVTGFKLNGAKYLWITDSDLQLGNDSVDTDIIGTSINLQSPVTASIISSTTIDVASAAGFTINGEAATEAITWPASTLSTTTQMVATTDDAEFFVALADGASGAQVIESSTKLKQNPSTGKLTVSGEIAATSFIGQRVNIAYASSNISSPTQNKYFYGGSNGLVSNTWNVQVSDPTAIPPQYINNLHIIPCGVKDVTLKSNSRCGSSQNPSIWIYTGSIDSDSNSNLSMGFAASQSLHGIADGETNGSGQHSYHINITGSKSFTPNPGHELMAVFMKNEGTGTQAWRFNYRLDGISTE